MEKKPILLLILLTLFFSLYAQKTPRLVGVVGQLEAGWSWTQVSGINEVITRPDSFYLPFDKAIFSFGFGVERYLGRVIYGGNVYFFMENAPGQSDNLFKLAILNYYYGTLRVGYAVFQSPDRHRPFYLYPSLGIGGGTSLFRVKTFENALFQRYLGPGLVVDGSINISSITEMPDGNFSLKIGARVGYMYTLGGWDVGDYDPSSTESIGLSPQGFYFRVSFGMGKMK